MTEGFGIKVPYEDFWHKSDNLYSVFSMCNESWDRQLGSKRDDPEGPTNSRILIRMEVL